MIDFQDRRKVAVRWNIDNGLLKEGRYSIERIGGLRKWVSVRFDCFG